MVPSRTYTIQQALEVLADHGHVTTKRVLRNVEKELGLHVQRDSPADDLGKRLYTDADIDLLEQVLTLQKAGLRLIEIRAILLERDYDMITFQAENLRGALRLLERLARSSQPVTAGR
jgi:DNA-binding transcriptional MerR regulator